MYSSARPTRIARRRRPAELDESSKPAKPMNASPMCEYSFPATWTSPFSSDCASVSALVPLNHADKHTWGMMALNKRVAAW